MHSILSRAKISQKQEQKIGQFFVWQNLVLPKDFKLPQPAFGGRGEPGLSKDTEHDQKFFISVFPIEGLNKIKKTSR